MIVQMRFVAVFVSTESVISQSKLRLCFEADTILLVRNGQHSLTHLCLGSMFNLHSVKL